jgi:hypothetical protein
VFPDNPDEVYFVSQTFYTSRDGGTKVQADRRIYPDSHDIWFDLLNPNRIIVAADRYVYFTDNRGLAWRAVEMPNGQFYRADVDRKVPYHVYGSRHDGSAYRGPSSSGRGPLTSDDWNSVGSAEVGSVA